MAKKKNYELEILISGGTDASLAASIQKARRELGSLERRAGISAGNIGDSFGGMSVKGIDALGNAADKAFGTMLKGAKMAAVGGAAILGASTAVGMGFESQMSTVQAISQASAGDMERLTALAKEMGETTQFSAEEAGQALEYMAMAGWKAGQMANGLPGIMNLAAASGEELGTVSDIVTDALTAFGMKAEESTKFADILAQASSNSNTNVAMMGETFKYVAPVAGSFGYDVKDAALAIGLMANAGIKESQAGTSLRRILLELGSGARLTGKAFGEMNIETAKADGSMRPLKGVLKDLRKGFALMTEEERAANAEAIAGKTGVAGLLAIVNAGEDDFNELSEAIEDSEGAAERMAKIRLDNLSGDLTLLKSASQGLGIEVFGGMSKGLRGLAQAATGWVASFTGGLKEGMPTIQRQAKQFGAAIKKGLQPVIDFGGWCLKHPDVVKGTLMGIAAAFGTFKAVQAAKNGVALLGTLSGMISAWPVAAAGLAAGAIAGLVAAVKENNRRLKKEDMAKRFGSITLSMEELDETARMIVRNGNIGKAAEAVMGMDKVGELAQGIEDASKTLDKLNWKIGMGFGLDETGQEEYAAAIDQMVKGAIDTVQESQYTAQISVQALFGEGSSTGNELIAGFNQMYAAINGEVKALGKQLGDEYSKALEDGVIDVDEARTIQELQEKLATVTQQVSQAKTKGKLSRLTAQHSGKGLDVDTFKNVQAEVWEVLAEARADQEEAADWLYSSLELAWERGELAPSEYISRRKDIGNQLNEQNMMNSLQGLDWSTQSVQDAYADVLAQSLPGIMENFDEAVESSMQTIAMSGNTALALDPEVMKRALGLNEIDKAARDGIAELWQGMQPAYEQLQAEAQKYREAGENLPKSVLEGLKSAETLGMLAGDTDVISRVMGGRIAENPQYKTLLGQMQEDGAAIPEEVAAGIARNTERPKEAANELGDLTQEELDRRFDSLVVNGHVDISLKGNIITPIDTMIQKKISSSGEYPHYAKGGLIERPTLSWFAEDSPEMAIPINGSRRSVELWQETGAMLGAYDAGNYDRMTSSLTAGTEAEGGRGQAQLPAFSPTINLPGGDGNAREQVAAALEEGYERWVELMERYQREQYRVAF